MTGKSLLGLARYTGAGEWPAERKCLLACRYQGCNWEILEAGDGRQSTKWMIDLPFSTGSSLIGWELHLCKSYKSIKHLDIVPVRRLQAQMADKGVPLLLKHTATEVVESQGCSA